MGKPEAHEDSTEQKVVTKRIYDCCRVSIDQSDDDDPFSCEEQMFQVRLDNDGVYLGWQNGHISSLKSVTVPFPEFHKELGILIDKFLKTHKRGKGGIDR